MRVLFPFYKKTFGGSDKSAIEIIKILLEEGYEVHALLQQPNAALERELLAIGVNFLRLHTSWRFMGNLSNIILTPYWFFRFSLYLLVNKINVVHTNDKQAHFNWALACFFSRVKHIWHQRTVLEINRYRSFIIGLCSKFVCVSDYCVSKIDLGFLGPKVVFIHDSVDFSLAALSQRAESEPIQIGFFGGLRLEKKPYLFLDFAGDLLHRFGTREFYFHVYGDSASAQVDSFSREIQSRGLQGRVLYHGYTEDVQSKMSMCDFIVSMCPVEAYGRVSIEAAFCGSIPVAANTAGYSEVIENGLSGLLVDEYGTPAAYSAAVMNFLLKGREYQYQFICRMQEYVAHRYSYSAFKIKILNLYCF